MKETPTPSSYKTESHAARDGKPVPPSHDNGRGESPRRLGLFATVVVLALAAILVFGLWRHYSRQKVVEAAAHQEQVSIPLVNVVKVRRAPAISETLLPGNITPLTEAYIYARASGYVGRRLVDIGDRVKQGQILATIESPELDQQVAQARAALAQAEQQVTQARSALESSRSQADLAKVTWDRYKVLVEHGAVARQDADQQYATYRSAVANVASGEANVAAAEHNVQANRANVERIIAMQQFEQVRAPFTGVITARNFDIGALVGGSGGGLGASTAPAGGTQISGAQGNAGTSAAASAGGSSTSPGGGPELYREAQIGTVRILINVPQENAPGVKVGQSAIVTVAEFPHRKFYGKVARTASALDASTRTMLTEVDVPNRDTVLLPGMYAQVQLMSERGAPPLLVPADSIIAEANGLYVGITADIENPDPRRNYPRGAKQIEIRQVQVGRDYGSQIEITSGLDGWEYVVMNPSDAVRQGNIVMPVSAGPGAANQNSRGPSERAPGASGLGPSQPGAPDSGGRGASAAQPRGGGEKK